MIFFLCDKELLSSNQFYVSVSHLGVAQQSLFVMPNWGMFSKTECICVCQKNKKKLVWHYCYERKNLMYYNEKETRLRFSVYNFFCYKKALLFSRLKRMLRDDRVRRVNDYFDSIYIPFF